MIRTNCTGCRVFTMCLGDPVSLILSGVLYVCRYCGGYLFPGGKKFHEPCFCEEFLSSAKASGSSYRVTKTVCNSKFCRERNFENYGDGRR